MKKNTIDKNHARIDWPVYFDLKDIAKSVFYAAFVLMSIILPMGNFYYSESLIESQLNTQYVKVIKFERNMFGPSEVHTLDSLGNKKIYEIDSSILSVFDPELSERLVVNVEQ